MHRIFEDSTWAKTVLCKNAHGAPRSLVGATIERAVLREDNPAGRETEISAEIISPDLGRVRVTIEGSHAPGLYVLEVDALVEGTVERLFSEPVEVLPWSAAVEAAAPYTAKPAPIHSPHVVLPSVRRKRAEAKRRFREMMSRSARAGGIGGRPREASKVSEVSLDDG